MSGIKVFAPASVGNIGIGFDIMGAALERPGDEIIASKSNTPGVRITKITGAGGKLPYEAEQNTAGVAALRFLEHIGAEKQGIELEIHKKMPLGSGMGSSAASAAAAVYAVSEVLRTGMSKRELLPFAAAGERLVSGGIQLDNVAPSLLTFDVHRLHVPKGLFMAVVRPHLELLTREMRTRLSQEVSLASHIQQNANLAGFIIGLYNADIALIGRSLNDVIIEPQRAAFIPGFYDVKAAALDAGALGCSISGTGPAIFALCPNSLVAENAGISMKKVFEKQKIEADIYLSGINQEGAVIR
ncbi:MAG: homoserine kinase [Saprospiraceae bacterium]|nr:homoserine kinase [Saprospiraceae bacterium]